jgi:diaminopimelate decarboxylase
MHEFKYKGKRLFCESLPVEGIADKFGTPLYIYSHRTLIDHFRKLKDAFRQLRPLICFSMKANSNLAVCKSLLNEGAGLDIVSGGELYKALRIKADPGKIVFAGVGKTQEEIEYAIKSKIFLFNVESRTELELIDSEAKKLKREVAVSIRLNPSVEAGTHTFISTARHADKFGLDAGSVKDIFRNCDKWPNVKIKAIHLHIGSQISKVEPFIEAIARATALINELEAEGVRIEYLNIGGGLGIVYKKEKPQTAQKFAGAVLPLLKRLRQKIILEPGRFIAGNSGILVTKVLYIKETPWRKFIVVDAGMNDLIRPALYGAYHEILPVVRPKVGVLTEQSSTDVVGPICESSDFLAKDRHLPPVKSGDLLAIMGAGAYGFVMSSNYNSRCRLPEVLVLKGEAYLVRDREIYKDLIKGERIPGVLLK